MKNTLLLGLLIALIPSIASADVGLYMRNKAGGEIVLTSDVCVFNGERVNKLYKVFARTPAGDVLNGCWYYDEPYVHAIYEGFGERIYIGSDFRSIK